MKNNDKKKLKKCPECGNVLREGAVFCDICGEEIEKTDYDEVEVEEEEEEETTLKKEIKEENKDEPEIIVVKCPNCGSSLKSFEASCPYCGTELRNVKSSQVLLDFNEGLQKVLKRGYNDEIENYIRNYPVPNTREDLTEFMICISSNVNSKNNKRIKKAWLDKMDQVMKKAELSIKSEKDLKVIRDMYDKNKEGQKKKHKVLGFFLILYVIAFVTSNPFLSISIISFVLAIVAFGLAYSKRDYGEEKIVTKTIDGVKNHSKISTKMINGVQNTNISSKVINRFGIFLLAMAVLFLIIHFSLINAFLTLSISCFSFFVLLILATIFLEKKLPFSKTISYILSGILLVLGITFIVLNFI